jgi:hypothetical protein
MVSALSGVDPPPFPKHVPPPVGTAFVTDPGESSAEGFWKVRVTLPKARWIHDGVVLPKTKGASLSAEVEKVSLELILGGPFQLVPSEFFDLKGERLKREVVLQRLKKEIPVLISVSEEMPEPYYLQLTQPEVIVIVLGARDGAPSPDLLPREKQPSEAKR